MPTNESGLVTDIVKAIRRWYPGAWTFKVVGNPYQMTGVPDLLVLVNGRLVGLEVKFVRPGESVAHARGRATTGQLSQIRSIRDAGGVAGVVVSVNEALALVALAAGSTPVDEYMI